MARICIGVIDDNASLPSFIERWIALSRCAGSCLSVASCTITAPTALPPSAEAMWDCLALSPTGTIATSGASGRASSSSR